MSLTEALVITTAPLIVMALVALAIAMSFRHRGATGVLRHAKSAPDGRYTVHLHAGQVAWNPEGTDQSWNVRGPGVAAYRLDRSASGEVIAHIDYTPDGGATRHTSGVVSGLALRVVDGRSLTARVLSPAFPVLVLTCIPAIGLVVGLLVTHGRAETDRATGVLIGWGVGLVMAWLGPLTFLIGIAVRKTVHETRARRRQESSRNAAA